MMNEWMKREKVDLGKKKGKDVKRSDNLERKWREKDFHSSRKGGLWEFFFFAMWTKKSSYNMYGRLIMYKLIFYQSI